MSNFLNRLKSKAQEQINNIENETLKNAAKNAQVAVDRGYQSTKKALEEAKLQAQIKVAEAIKLQHQKTFDLALDMAKKENYSQAIIFLKNIPANSELYTEAQSQIAVYEQTAKKSKDERIFSKAIALAEQEEYTQAIKTLKQISEESSIYLDVENKITEYVEQVKFIEEKIAVELLEKAVNLAEQEEYYQAIVALEQISQDTSVYIEAQTKKSEYQESIREKKAQLLLEKAINNANEGKYRESIEILNQISNETKIYTEVQEIIEQYKKLIQIEDNKLAQELFNQATTFAEQENYIQAIDVLQQIIKTTEYYNIAQKNIIEYKKLNLEQEANHFYTKAIENASEGEYQRAVVCLANITENSALYIEAQKRIEEYSLILHQRRIEKKIARERQEKIERKAREEKANRQSIKAASKLLAQGNFGEAANTLEQISENTSVYQEAQAMIAKTQRRLAIKDRAITVDKLYTVDKLSPKDSLFYKPVISQGGKLLCLELKVENIGKETGNFAFSTFEVTDDEGYKYSSDGFDFDNEMSIKHYADEQGFTSPSDPIRPKGHGKFLFVFDVNSDSKNFTLHWKGQSLELFDSSYTVNQPKKKNSPNEKSYINQTPKESSISNLSTQDDRRLAINDRAITVDKFYTVDQLCPSDSFLKPVVSQGGKLLCLELKVENIGKETGNFAFSTFEVTDDEGYKYSSNGLDSDSQVSIDDYAEEKGFTSPYDPIRPKGHGKFLFVFDVNSDSKNFTLHWKGQSLELS